jgi:hypothetical protein
MKAIERASRGQEGASRVPRQPAGHGAVAEALAAAEALAGCLERVLDSIPPDSEPAEDELESGGAAGWRGRVECLLVDHVGPLRRDLAALAAEGLDPARR